MNVSVFGLGYVGSVSAASFAADGHTVVGVDVNPDKVASLNEGRSPIVEKGLDELIRDNAANGTLRATTSTAEAVNATDLSLRLRRHAEPQERQPGPVVPRARLRADRRGAEGQERLPRRRRPQHGAAGNDARPGDSRARAERPARQYGTDFGVTVNPEFLREGTAIHDFRNPPMTLVGHNYTSDAAADRGAVQRRSRRRWSTPASAPRR